MTAGVGIENAGTSSPFDSLLKTSIALESGKESSWLVLTWEHKTGHKRNRKG
jgi:hypothetical protein